MLKCKLSEILYMFCRRAVRLETLGSCCHHPHHAVLRFNLIRCLQKLIIVDFFSCSDKTCTVYSHSPCIGFNEALNRTIVLYCMFFLSRVSTELHNCALKCYPVNFNSDIFCLFTDCLADQQLFFQVVLICWTLVAQLGAHEVSYSPV